MSNLDGFDLNVIFGMAFDIINYFQPLVIIALVVVFTIRFLLMTQTFFGGGDPIFSKPPVLPKPYRIHPNLVERLRDGLAIRYYRYVSIIRNTRRARRNNPPPLPMVDTPLSGNCPHRPPPHHRPTS